MPKLEISPDPYPSKTRTLYRVKLKARKIRKAKILQGSLTRLWSIR